MAEWIGHLLANVPNWLFLPLLIVVFVVVIAWAVIEPMAYGASWPFKSKRAYLGEKKHDKK